jgi:hypothetical protein
MVLTIHPNTKVEEFIMLKKTSVYEKYRLGPIKEAIRKEFL